MHPIFRTTIFAACVAFLAGSAMAQATTGAHRTISVTGEGEITVPPDMATVSVGVRFDAETSAQAMDQASAATAAILAKLEDLKVEKSDIQSGTIRLTPRYARTVLGNTDYTRIETYTATNEVNVKVRDLTAVGPLLSAVVGEGANTLNGVSFGLQDPDTLQDDARRAAVAEARRRAALYAQAADVTLGDLLQLNENGFSGYREYDAAPVVMEMASSASAPSYEVPVAPGEITLSANVSLVYLIDE